MHKPVLPAIIGPTASGKSFLALYLAKEFDGEIVNCDSVQMYRGFDIGSGKLSQAERQGIPHHLIDVLDAHEQFAAGEYSRLAKLAIADVESRGKLPIIAGGTGFYFRALVNGLFPGPTRNPELRERLHRLESKKGPGHLHRLLRRLDRVSAAIIHPHDIPKIIRAVEVCLHAKQPMSEVFQRGRQALEGYQVLKIGLNPPRASLNENINRRTQEMFDTGLVEEVKNILAQGVPKNAPPFQSHGYREALAYLEGKASLEEAIQLAQIKTRQYAKRQMTWFRKEGEVHWLSGFGTDSQIQSHAARLMSSRMDNI
jgi:tRNA dimethylallyltransferase